MPNWINLTIPKAALSRFFKYAILLVMLGVTLRIVFDGFSFYLARRSIDAELESKKISSLEYLTVLQKRKLALVLADIETRCAERNELAVLRSADAALAIKLSKAYDASFAVKDAIVNYLEHRVDASVRSKIDIAALIDEVNLARFTFGNLDNLVKPASGIKKDSEEFRKAVAQLLTGIKNSARGEEGKLAEYAEAFKSVQKQFGIGIDDPKSVLSIVSILEDRLKRLKAESDKIAAKYGDLDEVMSRYAVWTEALTSRPAENPVLDEMAFRLAEDNKTRLKNVPCERVNEYYTAVTSRTFNAENLYNTTDWTKASFAQRLLYYPHQVGALYRDSLFEYFKTPPIAQTLLVTLFLGALGALTINVLRLSKIGWWNDQDDPPWGEVLLCPLIGALAAFGIFLLGSTGLLLTSDVKAAQGGTASLSAFFIGLLGFVSGLLYDEAFGRVRRFGSGLFGGDKDARTAPTLEDRSLAEVLRTVGAPLAAEFVLRAGIGKRLAAETEFTLFVPFDTTLKAWTVQTWREATGADLSSRSDTWFRHHHALKRLLAKDVSGSQAGGAADVVEVEDGTKYSVGVEADGLKVNQTKVRQADVAWRGGVIHLLDGELS